MPDHGRKIARLKPDPFEAGLRAEYHDDVLRIVRVFDDIGVTVSEDVAFAVWRRFSEEDRCATWYPLGGDDDWVRACVMPHLNLDDK